jgi:hypothetical protein
MPEGTVIDNAYAETLYGKGTGDISIQDNIGMNAKAIVNQRFETVTSFPGTPQVTRLVYINGSGYLGWYYWSGTAWIKLTDSLDSLFSSTGSPTSVYVAGNSNSVSGNGNNLGGYNNTITGNYNSVNGNNNSCAANYSVVNGQNNTITKDHSEVKGINCYANNVSGSAIGNSAATMWKHGKHQAAGFIITDTPGSSQSVIININGTTEDAGTTELLIDSQGTSASLVLTEDVSVDFFGRVIGVRDEVSGKGETVVFEFKGCINNIGGTTALLGEIVYTIKQTFATEGDFYVGQAQAGGTFSANTQQLFAHTNLTSTECLITADDSNDKLKIEVKGQGTGTINWSGVIYGNVVGFGGFALT